jgi:cell division protein FtsQ
MWDNPRLLNGVSGFLVGLALLAATLVCLHMLARSTLLPLHEVELRSVPQQASRAAIAEVMARHGRGTFFGAPIDQLRAALEQLPWVRRAAVRRVWPDRLEVTLEEHVPLARWGTEALVNMQGERFAGSVKDAELPVFIGPEGSEATVARAYHRFSALVAPLGSPLERVVLTPRHAWQLKLANGMQLTLGRDAELAEQRLARFVQAYTATGASAAVVDLRYPGGFALKTKS